MKHVGNLRLLSLFDGTMTEKKARAILTHFKECAECSRNFESAIKPFLQKVIDLHLKPVEEVCIATISLRKQVSFFLVLRRCEKPFQTLVYIERRAEGKKPVRTTCFILRLTHQVSFDSLFRGGCLTVCILRRLRRAIHQEIQDSIAEERR